jgi:hypothetical protein
MGATKMDFLDQMDPERERLAYAKSSQHKAALKKERTKKVYGVDPAEPVNTTNLPPLVTICRYLKNRKLYLQSYRYEKDQTIYQTRARYISLSDILVILKSGREVRVLDVSPDVKTDVTQAVLARLWLSVLADKSGKNMPVNELCERLRAIG